MCLLSLNKLIESWRDLYCTFEISLTENVHEGTRAKSETCYGSVSSAGEYQYEYYLWNTKDERWRAKRFVIHAQNEIKAWRFALERLVQIKGTLRRRSLRTVSFFFLL